MKLRNTIKKIHAFLQDKLKAHNENLPFYITILLALICCILGVNAFIELTDELAENELDAYDRSVIKFVQSFAGDALTSFFVFITHLGDRNTYIGLIVLLSAYLLIKKKKWKFVVQCAVVLLLASFSNIALKKTFNRSRPQSEHLVKVNTLSYPSGHAMSAMAFYGFLIYVSLYHVRINVLKILLTLFLALLILLIGVSRIYLGVHYPSDVAAGFIGGFIWISFGVLLFNIIDLWLNRKNLNVPKATTYLD